MSAERARDVRVIGLVGIAHSMSHLYQIFIAPLFPLMREDLGVSYAALGFVLTVYFVFSALPQPAAGFIVDRYGGRTTLVAGTALSVLGLAMMAVAPGYPVLLVGAAVAGLGNSVYHPADFAILNARVSEARLSHGFSTHGISGALGFAVAPLMGGTLGAAFGWRVAVLAAVALGVVVLALLLLNTSALEGPRSTAPRPPAAGVNVGLRAIFALPVVLCFLYFFIYACGLSGIQGFGVSAMVSQYGIGTAFASIALTSYMFGSATGMLVGGFIAQRAKRHDRVAAAGLAGSALSMLLVASGLLPGLALPAVFALAGFCAGSTGPSRDHIVRASTPPGATGKVFGFVYSGLDVGALVMPVFYGWLVDHQHPQAVFVVVSACTALAIFTVLGVRGARRAASA